MKSSSPFFLLSFIPAVAYWLLETYFTLEIALVGGIFIGVIEMILEKKISGHVHTISKLNIFLIVFLGLISLYAKEGLWFKLQPTLTGYVMGGYLLYERYKKRSLLYTMLIEMNQSPPLSEEAYQRIELHLCFFLFLYSTWMIFVAMNLSTAQWLFWKTGGFYLSFFVFFMGEILLIKLIRKKM